MPGDDTDGRWSIEDGAGGRFEVVTYQHRTEIHHVEAGGRRCSVGQLHGVPAKRRALLLVKAIVRDEARQRARAERKARKAKGSAEANPTACPPRRGGWVDRIVVEAPAPSA